jgi:hypothetical protein
LGSLSFSLSHACIRHIKNCERNHILKQERAGELMHCHHFFLLPELSRKRDVSVLVNKQTADTATNLCQRPEVPLKAGRSKQRSPLNDADKDWTTC